MSIYIGELTAQTVVACVAKIKAAFPALPKGFYDTFTGRIVEGKFCDERLKDAVNYVIDTCVYPTPTIANFISYDKAVKFKTWYDMTKEGCWDTFLPVKFPDRPKVVWIHANDIRAFNLEKYLVNKTL